MPEHLRLVSNRRWCRDGTVCRAITLHLLLSCMRPSIDTMHVMLREGELIGPQAHLCIKMDATVSLHHPDFWSSPVAVQTANGARVVPACLAACVSDLSAGAKAAAILRAYGDREEHSALESSHADDTPSFYRCGTPLNGGNNHHAD